MIRTFQLSRHHATKTVTVETSDTAYHPNLVMWCSDWSKCDKLVELGHLSRSFDSNRWGHCSYFVVQTP